MTHVDCFAGPGGICTGMHAAGLDTLVAIEYIRSCCDTYSANHPEVHVINDDIRNVTVEDLTPHLELAENGVDIVTSGMPCETFSTAGNTSRASYDDRQFLFREGIRIAQLCNAKLLLLENVPGITSKKVSPDSDELIIDVLKQELQEAGYGNYIEVILEADRFGVPQKRKRYFILASRFADWVLTPPEPNNLPTSNVSDAFSELPDVTPNSNIEGTEYLGAETATAYSRLMKNNAFWRREGFGVDHITYHMPMKHRPSTIARFALLQPGEGQKQLFEKYQGEERRRMQEQHILPKKLFIKRNYRLKKDEASPTVTSHCLDEFVHPTSNRALTVRECARLQSFPDSYIFCGGPYLVPHLDRTVQDKYEQIGDAVPPLLAYAWGKKITQILNDNYYNNLQMHE